MASPVKVFQPLAGAGGADDRVTFEKATYPFTYPGPTSEALAESLDGERYRMRGDDGRLTQPRRPQHTTIPEWRVPMITPAEFPESPDTEE